jgi:hypothetical protein
MSERTTDQTTRPTTPERPGNRPKPTTNVRRDGTRVDADERARKGSQPPADA